LPLIEKRQLEERWKCGAAEPPVIVDRAYREKRKRATWGKSNNKNAQKARLNKEAQ